MNETAARYAESKAPAEDGQMFLWPAAPDLLRDTLQNHQRLAQAHLARIQNLPLPEVRQRMRSWIGHPDTERPLIATGHQAELHHPGVWVKNALIDALAHKLGGEAYHLAVDTDAPKHLVLRWPGGSEPLTDDPAVLTAEWSALVAAPTPAHLQSLAQKFDEAAKRWSFRPLVDTFLASMRRLSLESLNLPTALTNSLHELDWSLGLRHHALTISPLCGSEPYLAFVHHVMARADEFAAHYNAALQDYRIRRGIRTPGRPMPDMKCSADSCEVPFWLDSLSEGSRGRATVRRTGSQWALRAGDDEKFVFDPAAEGWSAAAELLQWLRSRSYRLAPRALTLTMVLRLLVADQFVHGIGGAEYDQVADSLMARHFGVEAPRFSVTTATLYFPDAAGRARACVPCLAQEGHALKHSVLGPEKMKLVESIAVLPRRSPQRAALFYEMHDKLAAASEHPRLQDWQRRLLETERIDQEERAIFDRELFYAIQPAERLTSMIERYRAAVAS